MEGSGGWGRKVVYRPESVIRAAGIRSLRPAREEMYALKGPFKNAGPWVVFFTTLVPLRF